MTLGLGMATSYKLPAGISNPACVVLIKLEMSLYWGSGFTSKVSILSHDLLVKSIYFVFVCSADTSLYYFEAKAAWQG